MRFVRRCDAEDALHCTHLCTLCEMCVLCIGSERAAIGARGPPGLVPLGVTLGAGEGGLCLRRSSHFRGFCDQVEGCAKARGMRLILMAHFALVVRRRSRHRVHSLVDKNHNRYRL